jgi:capsular polysaccharide biosynthesis protein
MRATSTRGKEVSRLELNEVVHRVVRRHLGLIATFVLAGLLAAFAYHVNDAPLYSATARLVLDTPDPTNQSQSVVIADTARAIATGDSLVNRALTEVGVHRDGRDLALHDIEVQALGSSSVVQLSVTDSDPGVAVALANAIAKSVIRARLEVSTGQAATIVQDLDAQIADLQVQARNLDRKIDNLDPNSGTTRGQLDQLLAQRDVVTQRLSQLQTERTTVEGSRALRPKAGIIDPASAPAKQLPGRRLPDIILGGLLGLLIGVGVAAGLESLHPTLVGRAAIAKATAAPILAELVGPPGGRGQRHGWHSADIAEAAMHVELVAVAAGIKQVKLMALDRQVDLRDLAWVLEDSLSTATVDLVAMPTARRRRSGFRQARQNDDPFTQADPAQDVPAENGNGQVGLVIVGPTVIKLRDLEPVKDFLAISGWPLLGVVLYHPLHRRALAHRIDRAANPHDQYTEVDV